MKRLLLFLYIVCSVLCIQSQTVHQGKLRAIHSLRNNYARNLTMKDSAWKPLLAEIDSLRSDGSFADIPDVDLVKADTVLNDSLLSAAFMRILNISEVLREDRWTMKYNQEVWERCQKAVLRYGEIEINRPDISVYSQVSDCEIPTSAVNIYFCQLRLMEKAEEDSLTSPQLKATCEMLKKLALRAWVRPDRKEDIDVLASERPLWQVAIMHRSVDMMDSIAVVCRETVSTMSPHVGGKITQQDRFTADGLCQAFGGQAWTGERMIRKTFKVLSILKKLRNTPWGNLDRDMASVLVNYFRGSSFYYYKGYNVPCLAQHTLLYQPEQKLIGYWELLKTLIIDWESAFNKIEFKALVSLNNR